MWGNSSASALAERFARLVEQLGGDTVAAKAMGQQRELLAAVAKAEPATLNQVAAQVKRGAPAIAGDRHAGSRRVVRTQPDPNAAACAETTEGGRAAMASPAVARAARHEIGQVAKRTARWKRIEI